MTCFRTFSHILTQTASRCLLPGPESLNAGLSPRSCPTRAVPMARGPRGLPANGRRSTSGRASPPWMPSDEFLAGEVGDIQRRC